MSDLINIDELRKLIRESLNEFNTNATGVAGVASFHSFATPNPSTAVAGTAEIPLNPEELQAAIIAAVQNLVNPIPDPVDGEEDGKSALRIERDRSRKILEYWVDNLAGHDALESAALLAGEEMLTALNTSGISHAKTSGTLAESKIRLYKHKKI
tara:strand:+ start:969 stop:1433 length:465 start_codon:yes stop_codon:yes gene_type:complete